MPDQFEVHGQLSSVSRRRLLALGGLGALAIVGLEACGGEGGTATGGAAATTTGAAPRRGGTLYASFNSDLNNVGSAGWGLTGYTVSYAQFSRLLRVVDAQTLEPDLLTEMPAVSDDGKLLTFKLREGVKFHDGTVLTAEDVKYSLERAIDPNSGHQAQSIFSALGIVGSGPMAAGKARSIPGIEILDDHTLTIELEQPNSAIQGALSLPMASIVPAAYVKRVGNDVFEHQKPVGSGPFKVASYRPGSLLVFERFADYFDARRAAYVDRVEFRLNVEPELAILRIQRDEQDLMQNPIPVGALAGLRNNPQQKENVVTGEVNNTFYAAMSLLHPAMRKLEVRQAITYATDKEKMVRQLGGTDRVADGGLFTPQSPYYQAGLSNPYDPEKARALLAQAGFADGFEVRIVSQNSDPHKTLCESLAADLNAVGIKATADPLSQSEFQPDVLTGPVIVINQWELAYPHGSYIIDATFTESAKRAGCCNFSSFVDPQFEQLAVEGRLAQTEEEQVKLYKEMDRIVVAEQVLWNPLMYQGYTTLKSSRVQGYSVPPIEGDVLLFSEYWLSS